MSHRACFAPASCHSSCCRYPSDNTSATAVHSLARSLIGLPALGVIRRYLCDATRILGLLDQLRKRDFECLCNGSSSFKIRTSCRFFKQPDIGLMESRSLCQCRLAESKTLTMPLYHLGKDCRQEESFGRHQ